MSHQPGAPDPDDWQPATAEPGELYTVEGSIRTYGAFARGLKNSSPRAKKYRRSMQRSALLAMGIGAALVVVVVVLQAIF
jgi:hypothetical protein